MDRFKLIIKPLSERKNKVFAERDMIAPDTPPRHLSDRAWSTVDTLVPLIRQARREGHSVMLTFGAHTIKNGMAPTLIALMKDGWCTHLATNGAGIIHDWELAYQGQTSEDVRAILFYIGDKFAWLYQFCQGQTALVRLFNLLANCQMAFQPPWFSFAAEHMRDDPQRSAAALDLCTVIRRFGLQPGFLGVKHRYPQFGIQAAAVRLGIPFTAHPMFGHDIIYTHPMNYGAAVGRTAERDFLRFADSVAGLTDGVYMSVGSAVMSPMVFEKSLSMSQNLALQRGETIHGHRIFVVDLAESTWDWNQSGEPPMDNPAYYLRYCKTFSRMGGQMSYTTADNRDFLLALYQELSKQTLR